jgi:hypothetical protein
MRNYIEEKGFGAAGPADKDSVAVRIVCSGRAMRGEDGFGNAPLGVTRNRTPRKA